jgi:hypothetical protein
VNGRSTVFTFVGKDEFSKVAGNVERSASGMSTKMGKLGKTLGKGLVVGTAAAAVGLAAVGVAGLKAAQGAEAAAVADRKLAQVFKSMGYAGHAAAASKYADQLERTTGVEAEVIKAAQTKLATFKDLASSTDLMARSTKVAADMSAAGFGDMASASVGLGKALQDPIAGMSLLSKAGSLTKAEQKEIGDEFLRTGDKAAAQESILKALEKQVGGVAEASATSGDKIRNSFGEISDAVGAKLLPLLEQSVPHIQAMATWIADAITDLDGLGDNLAPLGKKLKPIVDTILPALAENLQIIKDAAPEMGSGLLQMASLSLKALRSVTIVALKAAEGFLWLGGVIGKLTGDGDKWLDLKDDFRQWSDATINDMETVSNALEDGADWLEEYGRKAREVEKADLRADITDLQAKLATATEKLKDPELSATKRAKLEAKSDDLLTKIYEARTRLATLGDRRITITASIVWSPQAQRVMKLPGFQWGAGRATGGLIRGPGTGTSDSIPTMLSNGEYVLRSSAVSRIGVDMLDALNSGQPTGTMVPLTRGTTGPATGGDTYNVTIHGGLDSAETIARTVQTALLDLKRRQGVGLGLA